MLALLALLIMPVVTTTPTPISANPPTTWQGSANSGAGTRFVGPFLVGAVEYAVLSDVNSFNLEVYRSPDAGVTWTEMDAGNEPNAAAGNYHVELVGTKLQIIYSGSATGLATYQEFDTVSNTWGAADVSAGPDSMQGAFRVVLCPNGDYVCLWTGIAGSLLSQRRSGGVWHASILLVDGSVDPGPPFPVTGLIRSAVSDGGSTVHIVYELQNVGSIGPLYWKLLYRSLSSADAISASSQMATSAVASTYGAGPAAIFNNSIIVPTSNTNVTLYPGSTFGPPGVWIGTPIAAPMWTFLPVDPTLSAYQVFFMPIDATHSLLWWVDSFDLTDVSLWYATFDGATFGMPVQFYDVTANPPVGGGGFLYQPSIALLSPGSYAVIMTAGPNQFGSANFISSGAAALEITCDSPPDGVIGVPYSHFFPATGGTPPYTFAISSGALPDGLTIIAGTGEVSGDPTLAGIFAFTVQVTDSVAAVATVDCSITIAPPPTPPSPTTFWNPGTSVSLLCERNYPWSIPPTDRIPVSLRGSIPAPAANVTTELWEYPVPDGFWFVYDRIMFFATVTGYIDGAGSIIWILDANVPIGNPLPVGRPIAQFTASAGELAEPVAVAPTQLYQGDTLRAKVVVTDGTLGVGLPNVIHAIVEGWLFPHSRL